MASSLLFCAITTALLADMATADVPLFTDLDKFTSVVNSSNGIPSQTFRSSDIVAPVWLVNSWDKVHVDGASHLFLGTMFGTGRAGPMIFDARDLSLVYADQQYDRSFSSEAKMINGTRHLAVWVLAPGRRGARCLVFDDGYNLKYDVAAPDLENDSEMNPNFHEMQVTAEGTIIFVTYFPIPFDCSPVGGPRDCFLRESGFREVDPKNNKVLFNWAASEHFDIVDSYREYNNTKDRIRGTGYNFFHINSIEKTADGNYLISSRHFSLVALINGTDGSPIWRLGGRHNQFRDLSNGTATNFGWQHDARFHHGQSQITMFDNHVEQTGYCEGECRTRGLHLEMDYEKMTARLLHEYFHPEGVNSGFMGGLQVLDSGNVLVAFGFNPGIVEYTMDGTPVLDVQRGSIGVSGMDHMGLYRASKWNWTGRPTWPPSIAVDAPTRTTLNATVYLSWNGATDVASWVVLASNDSATMDREGDMIAKRHRSGFETGIPLGVKYNYNHIRAAAISTSGENLAYTAIIDLENYIHLESNAITTAIHSTPVTFFLVQGPQLFLVVAALYVIYYLWKLSTRVRGEAQSKYKTELQGASAALANK